MCTDENVKCYVSPFPGLPRTGPDDKERRSQEVVRPPETSKTATQRIAALRESLEDSCPQVTKSSSSFEEEYVLVAPIKGVDESGRLILGDQKIMSARALKI